MASIERLIASTAAAALVASAWFSQAAGAPETSPLAPLWYDAQVAELLTRLRDQAPFGTIEIDNVQIVDPAAATVRPGSTIIIRGTRIAWAGRPGQAPHVDGVVKIDGRVASRRRALPTCTSIRAGPTECCSTWRRA